MNDPRDGSSAKARKDGVNAGQQNSNEARRTALAAVERGHSLLKEGRYGAAAELLTRSIAESEANLGYGDLLLADLLNLLGIVGKYRGDFRSAEQAYQRALEIVEADRSGLTGVNAATLLHNLAGLAHSRGDARDAERLAVRGIQTRSGADHVDQLALAADKAALAPILVDLGRTAEASDLLAELIHFFEQTYGPDHYEVAISAHNLGSLLVRLGRWDEARPHLSRALKIKQLQLGHDHPELAITLHNLATVHREANEINAAADCLSRAITLLHGRVAPDHPTLASCRTRLAALSHEVE